MPMNSKTVWLYWENRKGQTKPPHIEFCHKLLAKQAHSVDVILVTPENIKKYLPNLDDRIWEIELSTPNQNPIAVRCAFIRAMLLEKYGGLYVDSDCLALTDYAEVFEEVGDAEFFAMRRTSAKTNHISIGFYGAKARSPIISEYADSLRRIIAEKTVFRWAEVGAHLITPIVDRHLDEVYLFRENRIHPIVAEKQELLADTHIAVEDVVPNDAVTLMLFHRIFEEEVRGATLKGLTVEQLASGDSLLSRAYRQLVVS